MPTFSEGLVSLFNALNDLRSDCISALNEKGVSALSTLKLSQIADKIREITTTVSDSPFNIFFDFDLNPFDEIGIRAESKGSESAFQEGFDIDDFEFFVPEAFDFEGLQGTPNTITANLGAYGVPYGNTGIDLDGLKFSLPTDFEMSDLEQFEIDSTTGEYVLVPESQQQS